MTDGRGPTSCSPPGYRVCRRGWWRRRCGRRGGGRCCWRWCTARSGTRSRRAGIRPPSWPRCWRRCRIEGITALDATDPGERSAAVAATIEVSLPAVDPGRAGPVPGAGGVRRGRRDPRRGGGPAVGAHRLAGPVSGPAVVPAAVRPRAAGRLSAQPRPACPARRDPRLPAEHEPGSSGPSGTRRWSTPTGTCCRADGGWADLPAEQAYLWSWLAAHLCGGGAAATSWRRVLADPRWLVREAGAGRARPGWSRTCGCPSSRRAQALAVVVRQNAHLLAPARPARLAGGDVRLPAARPHRPGRAARADPRHHRRPPSARPGPLPDLPHDALLRVLTGHTGRGGRRWRSPRTAPGWPPPAHDDTVRIWDPPPGRPATPSPATPARAGAGGRPRTAPGWPPPATTGRCGSGTRTTGQTPPHPHRPHQRGARRWRVAPDGTWLASAGDDRRCGSGTRTTGQTRHTLTGHTGDGGAWRSPRTAPGWPPPATTATVRIWDPHHRADPPHPHRPHQQRCGAGRRPGRHLAGLRRRRPRRCGSGTRHRADPPHPHRPHRAWCRRWRSPPTAPGWPPPATTTRCGSGTRTPGRPATPSPATPAAVSALAVAPDGSPGWPPPATTRTVRIWDPHTGQTRHTLTGHTDWVQALAVAPDGTWLASAGDDRTVRIWDPPHRASPPHPHRPHRLGAGVGGRPGRRLAGLRRLRPDGADLGPAHRADQPDPHRPHRLGAGAGGRPGRPWLASAGDDGRCGSGIAC